MYQLWIFNTNFKDFQKVGPPRPHADALKWTEWPVEAIVTLRQHFDVREMRLLAEGTQAAAITGTTTPGSTRRGTRWPGE